MAQRFVTEFVINGDSSSGVQATRSLQRAQTDLTREMQNAERQNQAVSASFETVALRARHLATVSAATTAALGAMAVTQTQAIAEQASLARSVGVSIQTLQQWEFAAKSVNLGAGAMGDIFKDTAEKIGDFVATGGGEAADLFERLNLNINELKALRPDQQLLAIGSALDGVATQGEKIFFMESLANDASRLLPLLENNAAALRDQIAIADQIGITVPQSDIDSIEQASQAINEMTAMATGFANAVAADWAPGIVQASSVARELIEDMGGMGAVAELVTDGTIVLSGVLAGRLVGALGASAVAMGKKVAADRAAAQQEREAAVATARRAEAEKVAAVNSARIAQQRAQASQAEAAARLREIKVNQEVMASEKALEYQRLNAQISATGRRQSIARLLEARRAELGLMGQATAAQKALQAAELQAASSTRALTAAKVEATRAAQASNTALAASTAAATRTTTAYTALAGAARVSRLAMAPLGGPVGVAMAAATAFYMFRDSSEDVKTSLDNLDQPLDQVVSQFKEMNQEAQQAAMIRWGDRIEEEAQKAESAMGKIRRELADNLTGASIWGRDDEQYEGYRRLLGEINDVADGSRNLTEVLDEAQQYMVIPDDVMRRLRLLAAEYAEHGENSQEAAEKLAGLQAWLESVGAAAENTGRAFNDGAPSGELLDKWDDYIGKLTSARDVIGMTAAEAAAYAAQQEGYTGLYAEQAAAVAGQTDALNSYRQAVASGNAEEAAAHLERATRFAEAEAMVKAQLDNMATLTGLLQGVQTELSAVALTSALSVADGAGAGADYVAQAIKAINDRAAAIQRTTTVTVKNTAASREADKAAREAQRTADALVKSYENQVAQLKQEIALFGETGDAAKLRYELEHGALKDLAPDQKEHLLGLREELDLKEKQAKATEGFKKRTDDLIGTYDRQHQQAKKLQADLQAINAAYRDPAIDMSREQYERMIAEINHQQYMLAMESETTFGAMATAWERSIERMDDAGVDFWRGFLDGTGSALDQFKNIVLDSVAEVAHALITRPLMVNLQTQIAGGMGFGPGGQAGAGGGFGLNNLGSLKTGWQAVQNGFSGIQWTGVTPSINAGLGIDGGISSGALKGANAAVGGANTGLWGGSMQNFSGMQGLGSMGAGYAGGRVGTELGGAIFGKEAGSAYAATAGAAIGTYFGGPLGAFAGGTIGGALDSLFGSSKKTFDFDFEQGKHSYVFGDGTSAFGDYGLTGLSDYKLGEQQDQLKEMLAALGEFDNQLAAAAIPARFDAMREAIDGFTHSGADDLFETRLRAMITGGEVWAAEAVASVTDPEKLGQAMLGALQLEQLGGELGVELSAQIKAAVGAARGDYAADIVQQTLAQAQAAGALIDASDRLNLQFNQTADGALSAAGNLAQYVGGVDSLTAAQNAYYQAAFTDQERLQHSYDDVRAALVGVTDDTPRTVAELRALVEAQSLNGDASQRLAADLMALAPALKETTAAVRQAITQQYQDVLGRAPAGDGLDYWFNLVADGSLTLEGALWNIANSAEAAKAAANGAAGGIDGMSDAMRERQQLQRQILQLEGNDAELRRLELESRDESNRGLQERIYALQDEQAAQQAAESAQQDRIRAIEQESQAWSRARDQLAGFGNSINDWTAQFDATEQGVATPRERLEASDADFWAQYEKALAGDRNAQGSITQYADRYIANLQEMYASSAAGQAGIAEIRDAMERLPEMLSPEQFLANEFRGIIGEQTGTLSSVLDLNGDGTISAIERTIAADWDTTQRLNNALHHEMNRLGTTVLTEAQVRAALGPHATDAEIARLIARVDYNGDGMITRQELMNARIDSLGGGIAGAMAPLFDQIDIDGSGWIDYDEFGKTFDGMATDAMLSDIFGIIDANGDGQISYLEAIAASSSTLVQLWAKQQPANTQSAIADISKMYQQALGRAPDLPGMQYWVDQYESGASLKTIEQSIQQHVGRDSGSAGGKGSSNSSGKTPRPFWERVADASMSETNREWMEHFQADNRMAEAKRLIQDAGIRVPAYATGAWNIQRDQLALIHEGESVVPSRGGIADEFRAYAAGDYHAELMGELAQLRSDNGPRPLPAPDLPMPAYPLLDQNDQAQAWRDLLEENKRLRKDVTELLQKIDQKAGASAAIQQEGFKQQINEQKKSNAALDDMSASARMEALK